MKLNGFYLILLMGIILFSCAKPNEPAGTTGSLKIEEVFTTGGYARGFAVSDEYIFIAEDQRGFSIYNYISGTQLCHRDTFDGNYFESTKNIVGSVSEDLLIIYDNITLYVFDISDIQNPIYSTLNLQGGTTGIEKIVLEENPTGGVDLYWTSGNVIKVGTLDGSWNNNISHDFPDDVGGFDFNSDIIAIGGEQFGIHILDQSTELLVATIETPGEALDVKIVDNYLIAAIREEGFTIYDISDISNPIHIVTEDTADIIYTVDSEGNYLVLSSHAGGVIVYDISEIAEPKFIGSLDDSAIGYTFKAEIINGRIFASTRTGVHVISLNE